MTVKHFYPLYGMEKRIELLREATNFSALDSTFGYLLIEIDEMNRRKMSLNRHLDLHRLLQMLFRLTNASAALLLAMDVIQSAVK